MKNLILTFAALIITLTSYSQNDSLKFTLNDESTKYVSYGSWSVFETGPGDPTYFQGAEVSFGNKIDTVKINLDEFDLTKPFISIKIPNNSFDDIDTLLEVSHTAGDSLDPFNEETLLLSNSVIFYENIGDTIYNISLDTLIKYDIIIDTSLMNQTINILFEVQTGNLDIKYIPFVIKLTNVDPTASINEQTKDVTNTNLYPNPVSSELTIDFETENTDMPIEVYSMNGQMITTNNDVRTTFGKNTVRINMSDYPQGMYLVRMGNVTKKVIKR